MVDYILSIELASRNIYRINADQNQIQSHDARNFLIFLAHDDALQQRWFSHGTFFARGHALRGALNVFHADFDKIVHVIDIFGPQRCREIPPEGEL